MTIICNICAYDYDNTKRREVECPNCAFTCCSECTEKYFISTGYAPQCMSCHRLWDMEFVHKTHNKSSQKRIREIHKQRLYNVEMSLLPETQGYAKLYLELPSLSLHNTQLVELIMEMNRNLRSDTHRGNIQTAFIKKELASLQYERVCNYERIQSINQILQGVRDTLSENDTDTITTIRVTPKHQFVKRCVKESCKGFVDQINYICGICDTQICKGCLNEHTDNHTCLTDDIATAKLILKDSKPCPECGIPIHKINGCNHMFCTQCNTPFDWMTMEIHINGNTNPHYYQWMSQMDG
jgi:hypothetical protein